MTKKEKLFKKLRIQHTVRNCLCGYENFLSNYDLQLGTFYCEKCWGKNLIR